MPAFGGAGQAKEYGYKKQATFSAIFCCIVASSGGLLFGYDLGSAGGVSSFPFFLQHYFPTVYAAEYEGGFVKQSPYCTYDNQMLQLFQSSLYLAALVTALVGGVVANSYGRRASMFLAGICYLLGAALTASAVSSSQAGGLTMLIIGRCLLGGGVGFGNSSVTIYSNEVSPPKYRGWLNLFFQECTVVGILVAQLINYGTETLYDYGWRITLAIAGVPAILILIGAFILPESPTSLISRNRHEAGRKVLQRIRGEEDVEEEFQDILLQTREASALTNPWKALFKPCYIPYLTVAMGVAVIQQITGINAILFYAPQLFSTLGSARKAALLNSVIIGAMNVGATIVAMPLVDRLGRRFMFITFGVVMIMCEIVVGVLLGYYFNHQHGQLSKPVSNALLSVICIYVFAYGLSWGPLVWLTASEAFPSEVRTVGMSTATSTNMIFTFIIAQCFLSMLCKMHYGVFLFFAGCCIMGVAFVALLLPECRGVPMEEVHLAYQAHWFWRRFPKPARQSLPTTGKEYAAVENDTLADAKLHPSVQ